jgi:hypothetical protein
MADRETPRARRIAALRAPLRELMRESCARMSQGTVPQREWQRIVRADESHTGLQNETRPDFQRLVSYEITSLMGSPALPRVTAAIATDPEWAAGVFVDPGAGMVWDPIRDQFVLMFIVTPFLNAYVAHGCVRFDDAVFEAIFQRLSAELADPTVVHIVWRTPLFDVRLESDTLDLEPAVRLRRLTDGMIEEWINGFLGPSLSGMFSLFSIQSNVEVTYSTPRIDLKRAEQTQRRATQDTEHTIGLLRLLGDRSVTAAFSERVTDGIAFNIGRQLTFPTLNLPSGPPFVIDGGAGERLRRLWHQLHAGPNAKRASLAFRRFASAADRATEEDRLIDYWVGLESLFTFETRQEVILRASLRIGAMLGATPDARVQRRKEMRDSYDVRSRVVHGGDVKKDELTTASQHARSALREALLRVLESDCLFSPDKIDEAMLRGAAVPF